MLKFFLELSLKFFLCAMFLILRSPDAATASEAQCRPVPEYDRHLRKVVISVSCAEKTLDLQAALLAALPRYTEIYLLAPRPCLVSIKACLRDKPYRKRIAFIDYDPEAFSSGKVYLLHKDNDRLTPCDLGNHRFYKKFGTLWAQDLFEVTRGPNGRTILLSPAVYRYYSREATRPARGVMPDNGYLAGLAKFGLDVCRVPLAFKGGNILVDAFSGQTVIYCGGDTYNTTRTIWQTLYGQIPGREAIDAILKRMLGADRVEAISFGTPQPCLLYHLDQALLLLPNRQVGIVKIVAGDEGNALQRHKLARARQYLAELRTRMRSLGYRILDVEMTPESLLNYAHPVNAIPYVDAHTGTRTLLMPVFTTEEGDRQTGITARNRRKLEAVGYRVIPVPTVANTIKGGIHCLLNVIE